MTARLLLALALVAIYCFCSGCGHKGDLVLPDRAHAALEWMR